MSLSFSRRSNFPRLSNSYDATKVLRERTLQERKARAHASRNLSFRKSELYLSRHAYLPHGFCQTIARTSSVVDSPSSLPLSLSVRLSVGPLIYLAISPCSD